MVVDRIVAMVVVINSVSDVFSSVDFIIGCFDCPITGVRLQPTVLLQLNRMINKNEAANASITFEEIVMVMIKKLIILSIRH